MVHDTAVDKAEPGQVALRVPCHLAVTMDGNGRWAKARGKVRTEGHTEGVKALRRLVEYAIRYGIEYLTVFSFSSENWSRPPDEIRFIFGLLRRFVASDLESLVRNNVQVRIVGGREGLDKSLVALIDSVEEKTKGNTGLKLQVAFNYGGKGDIAQAAQRLAKKVQDGLLSPEDITEERLNAELLTAGIPDPDLMLRTSGEHRISNFLIWQSAYSELAFVDEYWPDFDEDVFLRVIHDYNRRERRFGGLGPTK